MRYSLNLASVGDDKHTIYSYVISLEGREIIETGTFFALGERQKDESLCGHVALQRALRRVAKREGVINLTVSFDSSVIDLALEVAHPQSPLYPTLSRTTQRILKRFDSVKMAQSEYGENDATPIEAAVLDEALEQLELARTIKGRWQLFCDRFLNPTKQIR